MPAVLKRGSTVGGAKRSFLRNAALLAGGTAGSQLIALGTLPLVTRLYEPSEFGLLAIFVSVVGILSVVGNLRYELAITIPERDSEAYSLLRLCRIIATLTSLGLAVIVFFVGELVAIKLGVPDLTSYLWLLPLAFFLASLFQGQTFWAIRKQKYRTVGVARVIQTLTVTLIQIAGYSLGAITLIFARVVGQGVGIVALLAPIATRKKHHVDAPLSSDSLAEVASRYKEFPILSSWTGLSSAAASNLVPLLVVGAFGAGPAGLFSLAHRVLSQPMALIGKAVGDVFYRDASDAYRAGNLGVAVQEVFENLAVYASPFAGLLLFVSPYLFPLVFGDKWASAGTVAGLMIPWLLLQFIVTPSTRVYPVINKHGVALRFQLSLLIASVFGVLLGAEFFGTIEGAVGFISLLSAAVYLFRISVTYRLVGLDRWRPVVVLARTFVVSALLNLPMLIWWILLRETTASTVGFLVCTSLSLGCIALFLLREARMRGHLKVA